MTQRARARRLGIQAEEWVSEHLVQQGWRIRARNWRARRGEIDIIVERSDQLRFVEVKARKTLNAGLEAIGYRKRQSLTRAAEAYLATHLIVADEIGFLLAVVTPHSDTPDITLFDHPFGGS